MFHTTVKCADCGALMVDVPSNTKRCAVCRVGHNRESVRKVTITERSRPEEDRWKEEDQWP